MHKILEWWIVTHQKKFTTHWWVATYAYNLGTTALLYQFTFSTKVSKYLLKICQGEEIVHFDGFRFYLKRKWRERW